MGPCYVTHMMQWDIRPKLKSGCVERTSKIVPDGLTVPGLTRHMMQFALLLVTF